MDDEVKTGRRTFRIVIEGTFNRPKGIRNLGSNFEPQIVSMGIWHSVRCLGEFLIEQCTCSPLWKAEPARHWQNSQFPSRTCVVLSTLQLHELCVRSDLTVSSDIKACH